MRKLPPNSRRGIVNVFNGATLDLLHKRFVEPLPYESTLLIKIVAP
jgi:hypothetical protein